MPLLSEDQDLAVVEAPDHHAHKSTGALGRLRGAFQTNSWLEWLIPAALCAIFLAQLLPTEHKLSQFIDEPTHLYSGYRYLKCGDLTLSPEHPPLSKIVAAAPLLALNLDADCTPFRGNDLQQSQVSIKWFYSQNWPVALTRARLAASIFAMGLCLLVWIAARQMFGITTALLAGLLLIFEPNILAWGSLVMTDVPVSCMFLFAIFSFYQWTRQRSQLYLLLTGLAVGLTLLTKNSGVAVIPIIILLAIVDLLLPRRHKQSLQKEIFRNLTAVVLICVIATAIVWLGYGMRFASHPGPALVPESPSTLPVTSVAGRTLLALENRHLLPQAYLEGFASDPHSLLNVYSSDPIPAFILGRIYPNVKWFFYPLNFLIHSTAAFLVMALLSIAGIVCSFNRYRREFLFLIIPAALIVTGCMRSSYNGGIRILLPAFAFLLIVVAAGCVELVNRIRWAAYAVPCLIALHALSSLHAYPNYLSYANEFWGGPKQAYKYLAALDAGQSYRQLKDYTDRHPGRPCWLLTDGYWDPGLYGVTCTTIGGSSTNRIPPRLAGTVIVSSSMFTTTGYAQGRAVAPFVQEKPKDFIGGSALLVYEGNFDTRAAASMSAWRHVALVPESLDAELQEANEAVMLDPGSAPAHGLRCLLLSRAGIPNAAIVECETTIRLATANPLYRDELSKLAEQAEFTLLSITPASN